MPSSSSRARTSDRKPVNWLKTRTRCPSWRPPAPVPARPPRRRGPAPAAARLAGWHPRRSPARRRPGHRRRGRGRPPSAFPRSSPPRSTRSRAHGCRPAGAPGRRARPPCTAVARSSRVRLSSTTCRGACASSTLSCRKGRATSRSPSDTGASRPRSQTRRPTSYRPSGRRARAPQAASSATSRCAVLKGRSAGRPARSASTGDGRCRRQPGSTAGGRPRSGCPPAALTSRRTVPAPSA